jgi:hypothetical protein
MVILALGGVERRPAGWAAQPALGQHLPSPQAVKVCSQLLPWQRPPPREVRTGPVLLASSGVVRRARDSPTRAREPLLLPPPVAPSARPRWTHSDGRPRLRGQCAARSIDASGGCPVQSGPPSKRKARRCVRGRAELFRRLFSIFSVGDRGAPDGAPPMIRLVVLLPASVALGETVGTRWASTHDSYVYGGSVAGADPLRA